MFSKTLQVAASVALAASVVSAQTSTVCDPTKTSCPADAALGSEIINIDWRKGADDFFNVAEGTKITYDPQNGAVFTINTVNDAPTIISSKYIFFGKIDLVVQASVGAGIVTSFTLQSDDLDEIDWEWIGNDGKEVQTNYFSKGCTDVYDRGGFSAVSDPQHNFDTYTIDWNADRINWIINGNIVRTLTNTGASGCDAYPQTPMLLKVGTWVAGNPASPEGTIEWGGGLTDFSQAPFIAYYQSITVQDYMGGNGATSAGSYVYGDHSGTWQSIKIEGGNSSDTTTPSSSSSVHVSSSTVAPVSSSSSAAASTSSSGSVAISTGTASTTLTTVSSATHAPSSTGNPTGSGSNSTVTSPSSTTTTPKPTTAPNAAGKFGASAALMGVAALVAFLL